MYDSREKSIIEEEKNLKQRYAEIERNEPEFFDDMTNLTASVPSSRRGKINFDTLEQIEEDPPEWKRYDANRKALEKKYGVEKVFEFMRIEDDLNRIIARGRRDGEQLYRSTAGEVEARDTQKRIDYTAEQRKSTRPDIDRTDVVFTGDGTLSLNASSYLQNDTKVKNSLAYADDTITAADVEAIRSIGRKSVNDFSSEDIRATEKWARKFYSELGTKSPFFRAWFGDWRAYDTGKVDVVSVPTIDISQAVLSKGDYFVTDTGWTVYAGKTLNDDTRHHSGGNRVNVKSLNAIESILSNAVLLNTVVSEQDTNKKSANTAFLHKLYTPISYDGNNYIAVSTVEEYYNETSNKVSRRAYNLKAIKIEPAGGQLGITSSSSRPVADSTISISDLYALVKQYDKDFKPKTVNPVLLNEDGTPKMFYHGTGEDFTAFEPEQMSAREGSFFFAENREDAEAYGDRVMEVYLSGNNLADYDNQPSEFYKLRDKRKQVEYLKERGYDGWYADMDSGGWGEVSVFSPTQIKSATDNIGTFDGGNADIRYSTTATDEARLAAERKRGTYAAVTAGLRQQESDARKAKREFLPDAQTLGEVTRSLAEMGLVEGATREQLNKAVQDAAFAMRTAYLERNSAEAKARKRTTAAGKLLAAARLLAQKDGVTVAETAEAISAALYQTNTAERKTVKQLVEEYGEIKPGEKRARVVSVPKKTDKNRNVSEAVRTVMEARGEARRTRTTQCKYGRESGVIFK